MTEKNPSSTLSSRSLYDVTVVVPFYYPETSSHCQSFTSLVPYFVENGLKTAVLTSNRLYSQYTAPLPRRETHQGVDIRRFGVPDVRRNSMGALLAQSIVFIVQATIRMLFFPTRAVFCMTTPPLCFAVLALICRLRGIPIVLWAMDLHPDGLVESGLLKRGGVCHALTRRIAAFGYRHCAHVFTLGPVMSKRISELGIPEEKLTAIHNWVAPSLHYIEPEENAFVAEHHLRGRFVVLYSGNIGVVHTFDVLLRAARELAQTAPDILFLIVGDGPGRQHIEDVVAEHGLTNVQTMGYVPFDRLSESLSSADVGFVSFKPGFEGVIAPGKVYTFLKLGAPVVLVESAESDLRRIIDTGAEGLLLGPEDVSRLVTYLLALKADSGKQLERRRRNAEWYARNCSLDANAVRILRAMQDALCSR